ncbi:MAG: uroporphyrinogen-III synthase [Brevundimonas sp.]|uniref:uroporphyrinogen-III synthase n=1 Tax=Brevundimonas sp. TaxID=1871086 RepID=UPI001212D2E6|nr:uroporphyrinogen-III synthase [Brevundimonas sp.]RZJ17193.1 MAG: uroporphyrinogen-III synthase [Brevundimonas sp.]
MRPIRRVWITRARPGAARTADRLTEMGFEPLVAPLLAIHPIPDALATAPDLTTAAALAFTSPNGVAAFAALTPLLRDRPVFAVGDATAEAARAAGFADARSAGGDIHALARLIDESWAADSGLILNPGPRRPAGDLSHLMPGLMIAALPVYEAVETGAAPPDAFEAVLIHSPRGAEALRATLPAGAAKDRLAVCISPTAAVPLAALSFAEIRIADTPDELAMLAALGKAARPV